MWPVGSQTAKGRAAFSKARRDSAVSATVWVASASPRWAAVIKVGALVSKSDSVGERWFLGSGDVAAGQQVGELRRRPLEVGHREPEGDGDQKHVPDRRVGVAQEALDGAHGDAGERRDRHRV